MIAVQLATRGIGDKRVLDAMRQVPREAFVRPEVRDLAYEDEPLPIGEGQTISQPYVVALMIEAAELKPTDRVLEIGAGSGYAAVVMSRIAAKVFGIERFPSFVEAARKRLGVLGIENIELRVGDGTCGWPEAAPFEAILVAASAVTVPQALKEQLAIGGRLVIPVGSQGWGLRQRLRKLRRFSATEYDEEDLGPVAFVPLVGSGEGNEHPAEASRERGPGGAQSRSSRPGTR